MSNNNLKNKIDNNNFVNFQRSQVFNITKNFKSNEFVCQCGKCDKQRISFDLVSKLQNLRDIIGSSIIITSGYRCKKHQLNLYNEGISTVRRSQHTLGKAADISNDFYMSDLTLIQDLFNNVGIAITFIHVDTRKDKKRFWIYG